MNARQEPRGFVEQVGDAGECHVRRLSDQAIHGAACNHVGVHDNRARPGRSQLGKVLPVGEKSQLTLPRVREGGYTGECPVPFTAELQTETVRQFSQ